MLRTRSGLSRPVLKWVSQVAASLGATLAATAIWSAVPHPSSAPQPEMTSGGKFAARAVEAVAYDGLDAMPLPRPSEEAAPAVASPAFAVSRAVWEGMPPVASLPERPARAARPTRSAARAEVRRAVPTEASQSAAPPVDAGGIAPEPAPGMLATVAAAARAAWSTTASAGDALVARVVPQIP